MPSRRTTWPACTAPAGSGYEPEAGSAGAAAVKLVTAVIRPFKLADVRSALQAFAVVGLTVTTVDGYGRQRGHTEVYRGAEYEVTYVPKLRLQVVVADDEAADVVQVIVAAARTGSIGDGKVWVVDAAQVVRIRTGERGEDAL